MVDINTIKLNLITADFLDITQVYYTKCKRIAQVKHLYLLRQQTPIYLTDHPYIKLNTLEKPYLYLK